MTIMILNRVVVDVEKLKADLKANTDAEIERVRTSLARPQAMQLLEESSHFLQQLQDIQRTMTRTNGEQQKIYSSLGEKITDLLNLVAQETTQSQNDLLPAIQQMQETQMSFNLQYLMLQENMEREDQALSLLSNMMKSRVDTAKGTLSNIR